MSRWILVNEKLPKEENKYLCTCKYSNDENCIRIYGFSKNLYELDNYDFWV